MCVCVCVCVCARACMHACLHACTHIYLCRAPDCKFVRTTSKLCARLHKVVRKTSLYIYLDAPLNDACRLVTGYMKATPPHKLYLLAGIAPPPPPIRREVSADVERTRKKNDPLHPMFGHRPQ